MKKYKLWLLFFFTIFAFTFSMIVWTIVKTSQAPVHEDESFLTSYHDIDSNFNNIVIANSHFKKLFNIEFKFNDTKTDLTMQDIFYSQRVIEKKSKHKNMLKIGSNEITVTITDKQGNKIENAKINLRITRATIHDHDIDLNDFKYSNLSYKTVAQINIQGNWNITGIVEVNGTKGYLFIKTNTL